MHSHHFVEKCTCGNIISQCRCPAKNKQVRTVPNGCPRCKAQAVTTEKSNSD